MKSPSLSVVIPTIGRPSLEDSLESIARQDLHHEDEVLVVGDGFQHKAAQLVMEFKDRLDVRYVSHGPTRNFGNAQRTFGLGMVHGDYVAFLDDDDVFGPEAFTQIRKALVAENFPEMVFFKTVAPWGEVVWTDEGVFEQGNICTVQMVVANRRPFPPWPLRQGGNVRWAQVMAERGRVVWRREITTICRPLRKWWEVQDG